MSEEKIFNVNVPMHEKTLASLNRVSAIETRSRASIIGRAVTLYEFLSLENLKNHKLVIVDVTGKQKEVVFFNKEN